MTTPPDLTDSPARPARGQTWRDLPAHPPGGPMPGPLARVFRRPTEPGEEDRRLSRSEWLLIAAVIIASMLSIWAFFGRSETEAAPEATTTTTITEEAPAVGSIPETETSEDEATEDTPADEPLGDEPIAEVAEAVLPAVVQIEARRGGLGSGFVYDENGFIFTNAHVVGNSSAVTVEFQDGTRLRGEVVVNEPSADVAVVKVEATGLPVVPLATEPPRVGQLAIAMGSPFGLEQTVTAGIVSALDRDIPVGPGLVLENSIQTDAAINSGNSGGPLVNRSGEVMGINSAIFTPSGGSDGVGFAIPIQDALAMAAAGTDDAEVSGSLESAGTGSTI